MNKNFDQKTIHSWDQRCFLETEYRWTFLPRIFKKPYCKTSLKEVQFNLFLSYFCLGQTVENVLQSWNFYFKKDFTKAYFCYTIACCTVKYWPSTGKSLSEALILMTITPKYDDRLFITWQVQHMKNTSSVHVCTKIVLSAKKKTNLMYTICTELIVFLYWSRNWMNNLLSYFSLVACCKNDLPVQI